MVPDSKRSEVSRSSDHLAESTGELDAKVLYTYTVHETMLLGLCKSAFYTVIIPVSGSLVTELWLRAYVFYPT